MHANLVIISACNDFIDRVLFYLAGFLLKSEQETKFISSSLQLRNLNPLKVKMRMMKKKMNHLMKETK